MQYNFSSSVICKLEPYISCAWYEISHITDHRCFCMHECQFMHYKNHIWTHCFLTKCLHRFSDILSFLWLCFFICFSLLREGKLCRAVSVQTFGLARSVLLQSVLLAFRIRPRDAITQPSEWVLLCALYCCSYWQYMLHSTFSWIIEVSNYNVLYVRLTFKLCCVEAFLCWLICIGLIVWLIRVQSVVWFYWLVLFW